MEKTINRLDYVDKIKALACVLVVLGHFVMSMNESNILPYNDLTAWFVDTIYTFQCSCFFFAAVYSMCFQ